MRITFVLPFAGLSGGVRVVACYAENLRRRGHEVLVVSVPPSRKPLRDKAKSFVRGRGWPKNPVLPSHMERAKVPHHVIDRVRPIEDRDVPGADVVVATWWETADWIAAMSPQKGAKVYFLQQFEANFGFPEERVAATWKLPLLKIVSSQWLADLAHERFGQYVLAVVPNGVELDLFKSPPRDRQLVPTVGMMYATNAVKGCDLSLRALHRVKATFPELKLLAFGEQDQVPHLPLPSWSKYVFHPKQENLRDIYSSCDVWLCGSRSEGFHLPPHEAMACRTPVVSTRVGGPMDMIEDGKNGYLVDTEDWEGLADRLAKVLALSDSDWKLMSESALETARRFNWDMATEKFEHALEAAVACQVHRAEIKAHAEEKASGAEAVVPA